MRPKVPQNDSQNDRNDKFLKTPTNGGAQLDSSIKTPPWGGKKHKLEDLEIKECKLDLRNANSRGTPRP